MITGFSFFGVNGSFNVTTFQSILKEAVFDLFISAGKQPLGGLVLVPYFFVMTLQICRLKYMTDVLLFFCMKAWF